ncbi:hypothetical protein As57867_017887, partial [Aphanomyces stellatus]
MSQNASVHRPYSEKKEALAAWMAAKEKGVTKVQFSRSRGMALSTFEKWCANGENICQVEDGNRKHIGGNLGKTRGMYKKKKRPSDEREATLYDWVQNASHPIDRAEMRQEALKLWPEYRDETSPSCKTPGSFRKLCLRFAKRFSPHENIGQNGSGNARRSQDTAINDDSNQHGDGVGDNGSDDDGTDGSDDRVPHDFKSDGDGARHHENSDNNEGDGTRHHNNAGDNDDAQVHEDTEEHDDAEEHDAESLGRNQSQDTRKSKRLKPSAVYNPADPSEYLNLFRHINETAPLQSGRTRRKQPARLAKGSLQSYFPLYQLRPVRESGYVHRVLFRSLQGSKVLQEQCHPNKLYPKTTVVHDSDFGFGLRLDTAVQQETKIIEYVGDRISKEEYEERLATCRQTKEPSYLAQIARDAALYVDAKEMGNESRFINHSSAPNAKFETLYVDQKPHLMVVARKNFKK